MKIPKKVSILGRSFDVFNDLTREQMAKAVNDGSCPYGAMNFSERKILVMKHLNKDEQFVTFLHEINHAILFITGANQTMTPREIEIDCETKANGFFDAFVQMK